MTKRHGSERPVVETLPKLGVELRRAFPPLRD